MIFYGTERKEEKEEMFLNVLSDISDSLKDIDKTLNKKYKEEKRVYRKERKGK